MCIGLCVHMLANGVGSAASLEINSRIDSQTNACMEDSRRSCVFNCLHAQWVVLPENHMYVYLPICTCSKMGWVLRPCSQFIVH